MTLSYSNGAINKKTITIANYLEAIFFERAKTKFVTLNNEVIMTFHSKTTKQINHLIINLTTKNIKIWKYKEIYIYEHQIEAFEEFNFEDLLQFKSIIFDIASRY